MRKEKTNLNVFKVVAVVKGGRHHRATQIRFLDRRGKLPNGAETKKN
jgi:hypothetical protein